MDHRSHEAITFFVCVCGEKIQRKSYTYKNEITKRTKREDRNSSLQENYE